ncbi:hypothetical protein SAMN03097699_2762 [Flavobacteriaceae bacterium MAR_2010_188]|nr:hypothetical protein SAMN03097699_2762 [Flavobacteriaceae bacterium MAR_2010_188]
MYKIIFLLLLFPLTDAIQPNDRTIINIRYGESIEVEGISLKLIKVVDSRCPKAVMCVRAGEAKVVLEISKNGKLIGNKEIVFQAAGVISEELMQIYNINDVLISALHIGPYPNVPGALKLSDYTLDLSVKYIE